MSHHLNLMKDVILMPVDELNRAVAVHVFGIDNLEHVDDFVGNIIHTWRVYEWLLNDGCVVSCGSRPGDFVKVSYFFPDHLEFGVYFRVVVPHGIVCSLGKEDGGSKSD